MVGDVPYFVGNALEQFMRDFLSITFVNHVGDESYIVALVLLVLQDLLPLPQGSLKCLLHLSLCVTMTGRIVCSRMPLFSRFLCGTFVDTVLTLTVSSFGFLSSVPLLTSFLLAKPSCNNVECVVRSNQSTEIVRSETSFFHPQIFL